MSKIVSAKPPKKKYKATKREKGHSINHSGLEAKHRNTKQKIVDSEVNGIIGTWEGAKWGRKEAKMERVQKAPKTRKHRNFSTHLILRPSPSSIILCVILIESAKELAACGIPNIPVPAWCCRCLYWDGDWGLECECECEGPAVCWKDEDWAVESLAFWEAGIKVWLVEKESEGSNIHTSATRRSTTSPNIPPIIRTSLLTVHFIRHSVRIFCPSFP